MIDKNVFAEGMGQLGGAFGREIDGPVSRMYFAVLSPKLTSEQFVAAVTKTIEAERFWPSPAVILEHAGQDAETQADAAFRMVHDALNQHSGFRYLPGEISRSWDAPTWAGLRAIGGLREISECTDTRWAALVKKFCKAYIAALSPAPALPSGDNPAPRKRVGTGGAALALVIKDMALPPGDR